MNARTREDAVVISIVGIGHASSHFSQLVLPPLFPMMKDEFGVSYAALGLMLTVFFALSAVPQPIAGFIVDRYGGRNVLMAGIALQITGLAAIALAPGYPALIAGAALAGLGNSVFHPADFAILNARVSEGRLAHAFSAHGITGSLGFAVAPLFSGTLGPALGWRQALLVAVGLCCAVFALLLANHARLQRPAPVAPEHKRRALDASVLLAVPVVMCFLYFCIYAAGLSGLQAFSVAAMKLQYDTATAFAALALTCYMVGHASGNVLGGFVATRTQRHDRVAGIGLAGSAASMLLVGSGVIPAEALPVAFAVAGFSVGATAPSRDLIVRASTPPGATGRVYGFVYSGLDVGSLMVPVFYGWLLDHDLPQGVFYAAAFFTAAAIATVLSLPGRKTAPA